jgi:hypothetical protein
MCTATALLAFALNSLIASSDDGWKVSVQGADRIRIGMTVAQVKRILRDPGARLDGNEPHVSLADCAYLISKRLPNGLALMFSRGRLVRVDVNDSGMRTDVGARVGDTETRINELYKGHLSTEPHHYDPGGHYLRYLPSQNRDSDLGIVFETDGSKVTSFRAGTQAAIALVEGCS